VDGGFTAAERRFVVALARLDGASGVVVTAVTCLQMLSTYLLMLSTMTFEIGVIVAVVLGRSLGQHCMRHRRLAGAAAASGEELAGGQLECCTS